jgi:hypothetical protein
MTIITIRIERFKLKDSGLAVAMTEAKRLPPNPAKAALITKAFNLV